MRIVCQQTILIKYHALFVIFEKSIKIWNCRLLKIIGGALRVMEKECFRVHTVNHKYVILVYLPSKEHL